MLKQLYLKNYALFVETRVDFPAGLNILTGETGAGKSLLVGALGLIMGKRADSSVFMHQEKCVIEATFGKLSKRIRKHLQSFEEFDLDGKELLIRREVRPNGKSRAFINDTPVSLQVLRQVSTLLLDLHGQHENQSLLSHDHQLDLLDTYGDSSELASDFGKKLKSVTDLKDEIEALKAQESEAKAQLEYYKFQVQEFETAEVRAEEEQELEEELNLLQNSEDIREAIGGAVERLYEEDESIYNQLSQLLEPLRKVQEVSSQLGEEVERLIEVQESVKEAGFAFQGMLDAVENDPERLSFIEDRLALYHKLKLKYNAKSGAELVALYEEVRGKLDEFDSIEEQISEKEAAYRQAQAKLIEEGLVLEAKRQAAKPKLEAKIAELLSQVGFKKARFEIAVERLTHPEGDFSLEDQTLKPNSKGINRVFFLIQTNPGLPGGPLAQIASGGEISRVMLAIKAALAEKSEFPVLIFDEIDTGISGEIANKVGIVMQALAQEFQILSITHLPQIAAKGHQHFQIRKTIQQGTTSSTVVPLTHEERIQEVAQMLSGEQPTHSALKNAEELMKG
ncbi:MAG: DNA repair protein RecN [Bacteroidota bacterium]